MFGQGLGLRARVCVRRVHMCVCVCVCVCNGEFCVSIVGTTKTPGMIGSALDVEGSEGWLGLMAGRGLQ